MLFHEMSIGLVSKELCIWCGLRVNNFWRAKSFQGRRRIGVWGKMQTFLASGPRQNKSTSQDTRSRETIVEILGLYLKCVYVCVVGREILWCRKWKRNMKGIMEFRVVGDWLQEAVSFTEDALGIYMLPGRKLWSRVLN